MVYCVKHHQTPTGGLGACRFHVHNVLKALLQLSQPNGHGSHKDLHKDLSELLGATHHSQQLGEVIM